jgi:uncharacterized protein YbbC (DUF1343 family)
MKVKFATGLDILIDKKLDLLKGQRVGLVSHPAAVTYDLVDNIQAMQTAGIHLVALFGPEHGFTASAGDGVHIEDSRDTRTNLPLYSLYGDILEPTAEMLQQVDHLVYDLQDVGVRFYTYLSTLYYVIRAAGCHSLPLVVLDRPNPITGVRIGGPILEPEYQSFVGILPIPIRHGMTLGELALFINGECGFDADLKIIPQQGWQREHWYDQNGRIWVPTSPGIPRFETTLVYPGTCLLEGTNLSEGRGTPLPFEILGAPWVDGHLLAQRVTSRELPGVFTRPTSFIPSASKHQGKVCHGIQLHVHDREFFSPLHTILEVINACQELFPDHFAILPSQGDGNSHPYLDLLAGTSKLRQDLEASRPAEEIITEWLPDLEEFSKRRQPYLLYE